MGTGVLLALTGATESELVQALDAPGTGVQVVRRCADVPEVLAAALAGLGTVAVLSADLGGVDRTAFARLRQAQVRTVLVADEPDLERCRLLGADSVVPATTPTADLAALTTAVAHRPHRTAPADPQVDVPPPPPPPPPERHAGVGAAPGSPDGSSEVTSTEQGVVAEAEQVLRRARAHLEEPVGGESDEPAPRRTSDEEGGTPGTGRLVAVWGPYGAPGRTTLAVNLAAELAALRGSAVLVDADTQAPAVTQALGLVDDSSGIAAAARLATHGRLDDDALARLCLRVEGGLHVLTGLTRPDRWRELPATALEVVWDHARELAPWVVIDVAAGAEDEGSGYETAFAPRRHQATLAALAAADVVVVVGAADPVGMRRLVLALSELPDRALVSTETRRVVVVNRVRAGAAGPSPRRAVQEALVRFAGVGDAVLVPDDRATTDRAMLTGSTLRQVAPASPAREAVLGLAQRLTGAPDVRRRPRGRGRRLRARAR